MLMHIYYLLSQRQLKRFLQLIQMKFIIQKSKNLLGRDANNIIRAIKDVLFKKVLD